MSLDPAVPPADDAPLAFTRCPTPYLRSVVEAQRQALPPADFAEMMAMIRNLYGKYAAALAAAPSGAERGRVLHHLTDQAVATAAEVPVSCRRGCSGCCHFEVEITRDEAAVLAERVRDGVAVDRARLASQAARPRLSPEWAKFFSAENRCVFLGDDGACRIYDDRPSACRRLLVTSPAEACTTAGAAVAPVRILLAEILLSAAVDASAGEFASLPRLLHAELARATPP